MRNPWTLFTLRGKTFTVVGVAICIAAWLLGQRDVLWLGILLIVLPLLAAAVVVRSRLQLACERHVDPSQVVIGSPMTGRLVLSKRGSLPTGLLRFEDFVPPALGRRPRFTVHRFGGEWRREVTYPLVGSSRGRFHTGPLMVRTSDPFGLVKLDRQFTATSEVLVTPQIHPLNTMQNVSGGGNSGDVSPQRVGVVGQDDVLIREYRSGDDVRRVHWRSTARRGELMVRREEQAWDPSVIVVLDSRRSAHAGTGEASSFETAVSAAASVALHFIGNGFRLDLFDATGPLTLSGKTDETSTLRQSVIYQMTDVTLVKEPSLRVAAQGTMLARRGQLLVAVCGRLTPTDAQVLLQTRHDRAQSLALVLDVDTFTARSVRGTPTQRDDHRRAVQILRDNHWRVAELTSATTITDAWSDLERMGELM